MMEEHSASLLKGYVVFSLKGAGVEDGASSWAGATELYVCHRAGSGPPL